MSKVKVEGLTKRYAGKPPAVAVDGLDLEIAQGEFLVLLGPSGCGKTTTLRSLAGLESPDAGTISFGDRAVFDARSRLNLAPNKRNVGMVFQSFALWPHMTVRRNIEYPLRAKRMGKSSMRSASEKIAELVECQGLLDRYPAQLSGGQQQRIALARGLVAQPDLVLFDEPLSNLDARLRDTLRVQIRELHQQLRFTAVFVTHDQTEAMALGDRLAIMRAGAIEQLGTPEEIFADPVTEYVADFIGMSNRFEFQLEEGVWRCQGLAAAGASVKPDGDHSAFVVRLRPSDLVVLASDETLPPDVLALPATVADVRFGGQHHEVTAKIGSMRLQARMPVGAASAPRRAGQSAVVAFHSSAAAFYDSSGTRLRLRSEGASVVASGTS